MRLDADAAVEYVRARGVVPEGAEPTAESLGGGVSNDVFRVRWDDDAVVLKRPLPNLAVADDWPADVGRVHNEAAAARAYADVIAERGLDRVAVPAVRFEDHDDHVVAISSAPESARMWKADLLDGRVDAAVAARLGEFLAAAHDHAAADASLKEAFGNYEPFEQLRLDPYHATVAERHPDLAPTIEREMERVRATRRTLVHGDYSPKNVLVVESDGTDGAATANRADGTAATEEAAGTDTTDGTGGVDETDAANETATTAGTDGRPTLWLLDFEVAHWGDPAFDVAFMLTHLFVKSVHVEDRREAFLAAAASFRDAYADAVETTPFDESDVTRELGVLMLARVDGKSPVEYVELPETKETLRTVARRILTEEVAAVAEAAALVREEAADA